MKTPTNIVPITSTRPRVTYPINMAHRCVLPITESAKALKKKERGRILLRSVEAKELSRHLQDPDFVRFLRDFLGVIVTPDEGSEGHLLQEFRLKKAA